MPVNKWALGLVAAAALLVSIAVTSVIVAHSTTGGGQLQAVWCKNIAPGAQYESNAKRYTHMFVTAGSTAAQVCASLDLGQENYVPSSGP